MAITSASQGTLDLSGAGAETTILQTTTDGSYQLVIDLSALADTDDLTLHVYVEQTGQALVEIDQFYFENDQGAIDQFITPWYPCISEIRFSGERTNGANTFEFEVFQYD